MKPALLRPVVAVTAAALLAGSCGDGPKATAQDESACRTLQDVATALAERRSGDALTAVQVLADRAPVATDARLRTAADRFVAVMFEPVENENDMTLSESVELGRLTREQGAAALGGMIDACGRLGRPIHDLPAGTGGP